MKVKQIGNTTYPKSKVKHAHTSVSWRLGVREVSRLWAPTREEHSKRWCKWCSFGRPPQQELVLVVERGTPQNDTPRVGKDWVGW